VQTQRKLLSLHPCSCFLLSLKGFSCPYSLNHQFNYEFVT
jgi:hypothetical protein